MMREILELIDSEETSSVADIAKKLDITVSSLEPQITYLVEKRYLKLNSVDCESIEGKCGMCFAHEFCKAQSTGKTYFLTEKGKKYITKK